MPELFNQNNAELQTGRQGIFGKMTLIGGILGVAVYGIYQLGHQFTYMDYPPRGHGVVESIASFVERIPEIPLLFRGCPSWQDQSGIAPALLAVCSELSPQRMFFNSLTGFAAGAICAAVGAMIISNYKEYKESEDLGVNKEG